MDKSIVSPKKHALPPKEHEKMLEACRRYREKKRNTPEYIAEKEAKSIAKKAALLATKAALIEREKVRSKNNFKKIKSDPALYEKHRKQVAENLKEKRKSDPEWRSLKLLYNARYNAEKRADPEYTAKKNARNYKKYIERMSSDAEFASSRKIRQLVRAAIKRGCTTKSGRTESYLGCAIAEARIHIEKQFKNGMTWINHGLWHIDHIMPIAAFDKTDPEWAYKANHFTNLQPLWAKENLSKGSKTVKL